jgi:endo-1,4-beta-xylanase
MINEYGIANTPSITSTYVEIIQLLQQDDLIDAVGMQGHTFSTKKYGGTYEDLNNLLSSTLNSVAQRGLPIVITEMDIEGDMYFDENGEPQDGGTQEQQDSFQLAEYQRIFDLYWNHPSVVGITLWGWRPGLWQDGSGAYLIDPCTGQERPALQYLNTVIRASSPVVDIPTDVASLDPDTAPLRIYPIPVENELTIEGLTPATGFIRLFDLQGRMVRSLAIQAPGGKMTVDLTGLPAGLYVVQAGKVARKVIKQ